MKFAKNNCKFEPQKGGALFRRPPNKGGFPPSSVRRHHAGVRVGRGGSGPRRPPGALGLHSAPAAMGAPRQGQQEDPLGKR